MLIKLSHISLKIVVESIDLLRIIRIELLLHFFADFVHCLWKHYFIICNIEYYGGKQTGTMSKTDRIIMIIVLLS